MDKFQPEMLVHGFSTPNKRLREKHEKATKKALYHNEEYNALARKVSRIAEKMELSKGPLDIRDEKKFPVTEEGFNWKGMRDHFEEADAGSSFPQVLRAGVQNIANSAYMETIDVTYQDWTTPVNSTKDTEPYAPLTGIGFPREIGRQEKYPQVGAVGLDVMLKNKKYGDMFAVEMELLQDDQTGQFQNQARLLGEYMRYVVEALVYGKLASAQNMQYSELQIPPSETRQTNDPAAYPWCPPSTPLQGGGYNRPASFGILDQTGYTAASNGLMNQIGQNGLKLAANGNRLIVGPANRFKAATLMNSAFWPSSTGTVGGVVGGNFAINPIKGLSDITVTRWMFKNDGTVNGDSLAWYLVDDKKPFFVVQQREAMVVTQEAPNAGESFERDIYRWKVYSRMNTDFIDPRFAWQGNDGSVLS